MCMQSYSITTYSEVTVINTQPHEKIVFEIRDQVRCVGRASRISTALNILLVSPFLIICFKKYLFPLFEILLKFLSIRLQRMLRCLKLRIFLFKAC